MTSSQIRQSFLDFFKSKQHTLVPSSSLMPDSPNLLFTNAGMNQFVPIFLGQTKCPYHPPRAADTQKCIRAGGKHNDLDDVGLDTYHHTFFEMLGNWSFGNYFKKEAIEWAWELVVGIWKFPPQRIYATVFCPYLGQSDWEIKWKFDYDLSQQAESFKKVDSTEGVATFDESRADLDAIRFWAEKFRSVGLDPRIHIVPGNKKDNFWMMGETGPCGPCSELHVDLTPNGDTKGSLVNKGDARCIEIWNLVFIQFNTNPDGTFSPLPAKHVDTGMGFERVTSIIQGTKNFSDFANARISNYETDIFRPIFDKLEKMSGKEYGSTLPKSGSAGETEREQMDIAFRAIADHIRALSFAIADGIEPGNKERNSVLRKILRRAVCPHGQNLGFKNPFLYKLVDVISETMGSVFPEVQARREIIEEVIKREEELFYKTLDRGVHLFKSSVHELNYLRKSLQDVAARFPKVRHELDSIPDAFPIPTEFLESAWAWFSTGVSNYPISSDFLKGMQEKLKENSQESALAKLVVVHWHAHHWRKFCQAATDRYQDLQDLGNSPKTFESCRMAIREELKLLKEKLPEVAATLQLFPGDVAFKLEDTYGFPIDLTQLMARQHGFEVDMADYEVSRKRQQEQSRAAQKKEVISLSEIESTTPTKFVGFDNLAVTAKVLEVVKVKDKNAVILDTSSAYAEMGGQLGDTGEIVLNPVAADISRRTSSISADSRPRLRVVNTQKTGNTWLHFVEGENVPEIGSNVVLRVDEPRRNAIQRHHTVTHLLHWALHEVASKEASQKGSYVGPEKLTFDFNSAPLTPEQLSDIEKLVNERILENAGVSWTEVPHADVKSRKDVMQFFGDKYGDTVRVVQIGGRAGELNGYSMELCGGTHTRATGEIGLFRIVGESAIAAGVRRIEAVAGLEAYNRANQELQLIKSIAGKINSPIGELEKKIESLLAQQKELEKQAKIAMQRNASNAASELLGEAQTVNGIPVITHNLGTADGDFLQAIADALKSRFKGVVVLGGGSNNAVTLIATVSSDFIAKVQAGKIIQTIAPIVGGKGGGKPDNARGGGKDASKLDEALAKAADLLK